MDKSRDKVDNLDKVDKFLSTIKEIARNNDIRTDIGQMLVHRDLLKLQLLVLKADKQVPGTKRQNKYGRTDGLLEKIRDITHNNPTITQKEIIALCPEVSSKTVRRYLKQLRG